MTFLDQFVARRQGLLNPPASLLDIEALKQLRSAIDPFLVLMFSAFDGERDQGALLPAHRIRRAPEVIAAAKNCADMVLTDEILPPCFLEYLPLIATPIKNDIGVFSFNSSLAPGAVVELDYESGEAMIVATSWAGYLEAYIALSAGRPDGMLERSSPRALSAADLDVLAKFSSIRFPLIDQPGVTRFNVHEL